MEHRIERDSHGRERGRLHVVAALMLALGIVAGVAIFMLVERKEPARPDSSPGTEVPAVVVPEGGEPAASRPAAGPDSHAAETTAETAETAAPPAEDKSEPEERIVRGRVTGTGEEPVAGAELLWLRGSRAQLTKKLSDARFLASVEDSDRDSTGQREPLLAHARRTTADDDGRYELELPPAADAVGTMIATAPGWSVEAREVGAAPESAPQAVATTTDAEPDSEPEADAEPQTFEMDFRLSLAGSIAGTVSTTDGVPAPAMLVLAGEISSDSIQLMSRVRSNSPSARTRDDGTYEIVGLTPGEYRLVARTGDSDFAPTSSKKGPKVTLEPGVRLEGADLIVELGGRIFGTVVDPRGDPVAGASCSAFPKGLMTAAVQGDMDSFTSVAEREVKTDSGGGFEIRGLPLGAEFSIMAKLDGFAAGIGEPVTLNAEQREREVLVRMQPALSINGTVQHEDGSPAPDVKVRVAPDLGAVMAGDIRVMATMDKATDTRDDGSFTLSGFAAGEYRLIAGTTTAQAAILDNSLGVKVSLIDGDVDGVLIVLEEMAEGSMLAGVVVDDQGSALGGVTIRVVAAGDFTGQASSTATSNPDGTFSLTSPSGTTFSVSGSKPGYAESTTKSVASGTVDLRLTLLREATVHGRVLTSAGDPVDSGRVKYLPAGKDLTGIEAIQKLAMRGAAKSGAAIGEDGSFVLKVAPGEVELLADVPAFAPGRSSLLEVEPGGEYEEIEILVTRGAFLSGRVVSSVGAPLANAAVRIGPEGDANDYMARLLPQMFARSRDQTTSDEDGNWRLEHQAPGEYVVSASLDGYAPSKPRTVSIAGDIELSIPDLVLPTGGTVAGRVLELAPEGDKPRAGMMVQLIGDGPIKQLVSGEDGSFSFAGVPPGEYMLQVVDIAAMQKGQMTMKSRFIEVRDASVEIDIVFGKGRRVRGKIEGLPPAPMRTVTLRRPGGPAPEDLDLTDVMKAQITAAKYQAGMGFVKADGTFEIADVEAGEYILEVPRMPENPTDIEAYKTMDRTPHLRKKIEVKDEDLELELRVSATDR